MPRTNIPIQIKPANGGEIDVVAFTAADQANGMEFVNDGRTTLMVLNGDASPHTATIASIKCSHGRLGDATIVVTAGDQGDGGPYPTDLFQQSGGLVHVDFDADTSVTVACIRQPA